jgi:hypothetical protein
MICHAGQAQDLVRQEGSLAAFVWRYEPVNRLARPQTASTSVPRAQGSDDDGRRVRRAPGSLKFDRSARHHTCATCSSCPPTQVEFVKEDVPRAVSMIIAIGQGTYAFAPAAFGLIRALSAHGTAAEGPMPALFLAAAAIQTGAVALLLLGRRGGP